MRILFSWALDCPGVVITTRCWACRGCIIARPREGTMRGELSGGCGCRRGFVRLACWLVLAVFFVLPLRGQTFRGRIVGTVTDPTGAAIPEARIVARNVATGLERSTVTGPDGTYSLSELPVGTYVVTVNREGFQQFRATGIRVEVAVEVRVDATLRPGTVTQTVTVSGETLPQVETTSNVLGGMIGPTELQTLPANGGDYQKFIYMVPGI